MDALNRSTTTRPLALAAMLLVAGVLFLRALSLLGTPVDTDPVGSPQEQRFTALLEPVIGPDRVRTSIQKNANGQTVWLILVDGPPVPEGMTSGYMQTVMELATARGFNTNRDTIRILQQPFAKSATGALTPIDMAEIGALGLALLLLLGLSLSQSTQDPARELQLKPEASNQPEPARPPEPLNDNGIRRAAALANAAPDRSAALIRRWMKEDQT